MRQPKMRQRATKDELARKYGFQTYAALLAVSTPVPEKPDQSSAEEEAKCYVAMDPNGRWFVWNDEISQGEEGFAESPPEQVTEN